MFEKAKLSYLHSGCPTLYGCKTLAFKTIKRGYETHQIFLLLFFPSCIWSYVVTMFDCKITPFHNVQNDVPACKTSSHMLRHLRAVHEDEEEEWQNIEFGMKILKSTRTAFARKIIESVLIQKSRQHNIMNNKTEFNRCALPRLTAKLGEKELDK